MAADLKLAHERRKLKLKATVLNNRQRIAELQEQNKRAREELKSLSPKRNSSQDVISGIRKIR